LAGKQIDEADLFRLIEHYLRNRRSRARGEMTPVRILLLNFQIENWSRYPTRNGTLLFEDPYVHDYILGIFHARPPVGRALSESGGSNSCQQPFIEYLTTRLGFSRLAAETYLAAALARKASGSDGYRDGFEVGRNLLSRQFH
jgi:hypothetical protein